MSLRQIIPELKKRRIRLALENHEYETSDELAAVMKRLDTP